MRNVFFLEIECFLWDVDFMITLNISSLVNTAQHKYINYYVVTIATVIHL